jgi:hypothetical protein
MPSLMGRSDKRQDDIQGPLGYQSLNPWIDFPVKLTCTIFFLSFFTLISLYTKSFDHILYDVSKKTLSTKNFVPIKWMSFDFDLCKIFSLVFIPSKFERIVFSFYRCVKFTLEGEYGLVLLR